MLSKLNELENKGDNLFDFYEADYNPLDLYFFH